MHLSRVIVAFMLLVLGYVGAALPMTLSGENQEVVRIMLGAEGEYVAQVFSPGDELPEETNREEVWIKRGKLIGPGGSLEAVETGYRITIPGEPEIISGAAVVQLFCRGAMLDQPELEGKLEVKGALFGFAGKESVKSQAMLVFLETDTNPDSLPGLFERIELDKVFEIAILRYVPQSEMEAIAIRGIREKPELAEGARDPFELFCMNYRASTESRPPHYAGTHFTGSFKQINSDYAAIEPDGAVLDANASGIILENFVQSESGCHILTREGYKYGDSFGSATHELTTIILPDGTRQLALLPKYVVKYLGHTLKHLDTLRNLNLSEEVMRRAIQQANQRDADFSINCLAGYVGNIYCCKLQKEIPSMFKPNNLLELLQDSDRNRQTIGFADLLGEGSRLLVELKLDLEGEEVERGRLVGNFLILAESPLLDPTGSHNLLQLIRASQGLHIIITLGPRAQATAS